MKKLLFPAVFMMMFLVMSFVMAAFYFGGALSKTESPTFESVWKGTWSPVFEKNLNESLPVFEPSRNFWGKTEYDLFGEGRSGVVVGAQGWLFTDEEFSCLPKHQDNTKENLDYIHKVSKIFEEKSVKLYVAVIPAKARIYEDLIGDYKIPSCRQSLYADIITDLKGENIPVVSMVDAFKADQNKDSLFLKTDTHWTTTGAKSAAGLIAAAVDASLITHKNFISAEGKAAEHKGDLLRYLPGVQNDIIRPDTLAAFETQEEKAEGGGAEQDAAASLFGEDVPPVTLVGTSYSANQAWHFQGFLQDALDADILNMADEGQGPFTVMEKYLEGDALKNSPPKVVIWEIPERYVPVKTKFAQK